MFESHTINAEHKDLIHDVAFDHYGTRMATCSSDQSVKVWDKDKYTNEWKKTAVWKAHSGSVWKVTWAHPEFGQVLATCSFDRTVAVWEEIVSESNNTGVLGVRHWARRTNLVDSRTSVTDVKFAPKTLGLMLAACSVDGIIRIYEAPDIMNLSQWTLQHEVVFKLQCSCISWNPAYSRERRSNRSKIKIPSNNERKELGCKPEDFDRNALKCILPLEKNDIYVVIPQVPMLAVGSDDTSAGTSNKISIWQYSEFARRWTKIEHVSSPITEPVHDIAFAPRLGRSYDLLAIASKDVKIYTLIQIMDVMGSLRYEVQLAACFDDHNSSVWRVSWNVVGSILASSGDDGCIRMWRALQEVISSSRKRDFTVGFGKSGQSGEMESEKLHKTPTATDFSLLTQGLRSIWGCGAVIRGDGHLVPSDSAEAMNPAVAPSVTTRYFKLAGISHPSQVPWH